MDVGDCEGRRGRGEKISSCGRLLLLEATTSHRASRRPWRDLGDCLSRTAGVVDFRMRDAMAFNEGVCMRTGGLERDPRVDTIISLVTTELGHRWTVPELAQRVSLSPSRLRHLFVSQMGLPPVSYLRRLRLFEASRLLGCSHLKVKEIMRRVGLADGSHFARGFAAMFGMPPKQHRRSQRSRVDRRNGQHSGEIAYCDSGARLATRQTPSVIESNDIRASANSRRRLAR